MWDATVREEAVRTVSIDYLAGIGLGIKTTTYWKLMYPIYSDDEHQYGIVHIAVFGMN